MGIRQFQQKSPQALGGRCHFQRGDLPHQPAQPRGHADQHAQNKVESLVENAGETAALDREHHGLGHRPRRHVVAGFGCQRLLAGAVAGRQRIQRDRYSGFVGYVQRDRAFDHHEEVMRGFAALIEDGSGRKSGDGPDGDQDGVLCVAQS